MDLSRLFNRGFLILIILSVHSLIYGQKNLLCLQDDNISVYYTIYKNSEEAGEDKWQVNLEVVNEKAYDLYYKSYRKPALPGPVLAPFLEVKVVNELGGEYQTHYVHGGITLVLTTDGSTILKVDVSRNIHSFEVRVKKDERPVLEGQFTETLLSLAEVKKKRSKKE